MKNFEQQEYPKTVYDNAWEDLDVMCESWKTVHGIDQQFCIEMIRKFANHLEKNKRQINAKHFKAAKKCWYVAKTD